MRPLSNRRSRSARSMSLPARLLATLTLLVFAAAPAAVAQDLAITDVTTIDPRSGMVRAHQTVLVDGGVIRSITSGLPDGAEPETVIDGSGRFLIPGLWDMHVHLSMHTETDLAMLVVNGVVSVRGMGGDPFAIADLESRIAAGELVGPTIWNAGSVLEDRRWLSQRRKATNLSHRLPVDNPEEARAMVALLASWGVDHVKTRNVADEATLGAIVDAAHEHGLTVAGHEPIVVDIDEAARLGMTTFEHIPFISLTLPGKEADAERMASVVEALRESGSYVTPTLVAARLLGASPEESRAAVERPDERYQYLSEKAKGAWLESLEDDAGPLPWNEMKQRSIEMLRQMHAAGVPFLAGTDMGVPLTFPGFALHDELEAMVDRIGLSELEALRSATSHPADLFGIEAGSVAPGMPADLILLDQDPLLDISNTRTIEAVVLRGRLIDQAEIEDLLAFVRQNKDRESDRDSYAELEAACNSDDPDCLARLAGYQFSLFRYADARRTYDRALDAGAGSIALEGLFSSAVNLLHDGEGECDEAAEITDEMLARCGDDPDKAVGVLDRFLAPATAQCPAAAELFLSRLAAIDEGALDDEMRPIYRQHYASYLAKVRDEPAAAFAYRIERMPEGWRESVARLQEVATWCLEQGLALEKARELAQKAQSIAPDPIGRLESMLLEARIASAAGDHQDAVALMETIDEAVPNNDTVTELLETFRQLAAEAAADS